MLRNDDDDTNNENEDNNRASYHLCACQSDLGLKVDGGQGGCQRGGEDGEDTDPDQNPYYRK